METTTLTIHLPKDVSLALEDKAKINGKGVAEYVEDLLERQARRQTLDEILAPIRNGFEESGMSESDLEKLIDEEIRAVRAERRKRLVSVNE